MGPDARVKAAIDHWGPRFLLAGVDYGDFLATTGRTERWEDWLHEWTATADVHASQAREAEAAGHTRTAGEAWARAAVCLHFGCFVWVVDEERHREARREAVAATMRSLSLLDPSAERVEAPLDGAKVVATLRRPAMVPRPPVVVVIPGLDSTKEEFTRLEQCFLDRGIATATLDGPGQGETGFDLPLRHDYEVAVTALLDVLSDRVDLDYARAGAIGMSMGGYYAPRAAVFDERIRALAGVSGPFCFGEVWDGLPELTREIFTWKCRARDATEARRTAEAFDLDGVIERLDRPYLVMTGRRDRVIPWQQTQRQARRARAARFVLHPDGDHGCANVPYKAAPAIADWLRDQLAWC